jgi:hypothetical protein
VDPDKALKMSTSFPQPSLLWRAIEIYLGKAYDGAPPAGVRTRLESLRNQPAGHLELCPVMEKDSNVPPNRYSLRLGNRGYPHMKLSVERINPDLDFFFKADTHDKHCCPSPESREYKVFLALMESNEAVAKKIEAAWGEAGVPTFREFLRADLARRQDALRMSS